MMWYDAMEVARFILTECFKKNVLISNLKLQKMLYYVWVDFYKMTERKLFFDEFCAWQLGPVVPSVYYEYCSYAGRPISVYYENMIIEDYDRKLLQSIVFKYAQISANRLVSMTHQHGSAWDEVYREGLGNRCVIPFELIIKKEVG